MRSLMGILCVALGVGAGAREPLIVIYDSGDTLPLAPYLPTPRQNSTPQEPKTQWPFSLPILTPSMNVGRVTVTPKALRYLQQPLFLIGADPVSREWLTAKREQLIRVGAVGLLIEAKDRQDVEAVLAIADGLRLVPASAEGFAAQLGLTHYPILLSKAGWEQ